MVTNAKASRVESCIGCHTRIESNELRIKRKVEAVESDENQNQTSRQVNWYHVACFVRLRTDIGWLPSGDSLPGFSRLSDNDKLIIQMRIP